LFTSLVFSFLKDVGMCGDLVFMILRDTSLIVWLKNVHRSYCSVHSVNPSLPIPVVGVSDSLEYWIVFLQLDGIV
jgi:hypothetical protein